MPAGEVIFSDGVLLEVNDGTAHAFVSVVDLDTLTPPGHEARTVERKRLGVTTIVEYKVSPRKDPGECAFGYEMTDALQIRLDALVGKEKYTDGTAVAWRTTTTDGLRQAFNGALLRAKPRQMQAEQLVMGDGAIKVMSVITITDTIP